MAKLGIQAIIFGAQSREDLPGVLRDVKNAGYDGLEFGRTDRTPDEVRRLFTDASLELCGYHAGYGTFADEEALKRDAEQLRAVGGKYLMCSGAAGRDLDGYKKSGDVFNRAGQILSDMGIHFCYHNHNWEFFPLDGGGTGMDILLSDTDPNVVKLCPDVYWLACAGVDPADFLRQHRDRIVYLHFKDGTFDAQAQQPLTFTELGRGQVDLPDAYAAAQELETEWIVTEQDKTEGTPAESARISAEYARQTLGI